MGRVITYFVKNGMYLNITNWCSNNCIFCFRNSQERKYNYKDYNLNFFEDPSEKDIFEDILKKSQGKNFEEIVYCGIGEPLYRLDDVILSLTPKLKKIFSKPLRINTNGHSKLLFPGRDISQELVDVGINKFSISLNAENFWLYNKICRPKYINNIMDDVVYSSLCEFIKECVSKSRLEVELSILEFSEGILPEGIPVPNLKECGKIAKDFGTGIIVRKYYGPKLDNIKGG